MVSINALLVAVAVTGAGETVLLDFTSDNCVYCVQMEPTVQRLEAAGYPIRKINVSQQRNWAQHFGVQGVPAYVMISDGREVGRVVGRTEYDSLVQLFEQARFKPPGASPRNPRYQSPDDEPTPRPTPRPTPSAPGHRAPPLLGPSPLPGSSPLLSPPPRGNVPAAAVVLQDEQDLNPEQRALAATVRLTIEYAGRNPGESILDHATGTIIDVHGDDALVLTCGHVFRDSQGKGKITVDLIRHGAPLSVRGELIEFNAQARDIALVSIRPGVKIAAVQVAASSYELREGRRLFSVGCNNGKDPSVMQSRLMRVSSNRDPQKIDAAGSPIDGRSGGGLFDSDGLLVGVCNGNYVRENLGMYAGLKTVHWQLDQIGQTQIYERSADTVASPVLPRRETPSRESRETPDRLGEFEPPRRESPRSEVAPTHEAIVILRNERGEVETITISNPAPEFLRSVRMNQTDQQSRNLASRERLSAPAGDEQVIRGQSGN